MKIKDYTSHIIESWRLSLTLKDEIKTAEIEELRENWKKSPDSEKIQKIRDYISERIEKIIEIKKEFGI
jgi:hypothetical protein